MTASRSVAPARDLRILVAASFVSVLGDAAALIALMLRVHDNGGGGWAIAGLLVAGSAPMVVLSPAAGALVDRVDSRRAIAVAAVAQAGCALGLAAVHGMIATLVLVVALTTAGTVVGPAVGALVPRTVPSERWVHAAAALQSAFVMGNLA